MNFYDEFKRYLANLEVEFFVKDGKVQFHSQKKYNWKAKLIFPNPTYANYKLVKVDGIYTAIKTDDFKKGKDIPVPLTDDTIYKYLSNLQTFLRWATDRGYEVNPIFKKWEIIERVHPPISLGLDELEKIEQLNITSDLVKEKLSSKKNYRKDQSELTAQALSIARDYLVAECRTGARISNIKRISPDQIQDNRWVYTVFKGNRLSEKIVRLPFTGYSLPAYFIFQKYGFRMPTVDEHKINEHIKTVCKLAGIDQEIYIERWCGNKKIRMPGKKYEFISSHTGRKTCVTILGNIYNVPIKIIMQLTGISDIKTVMHYLGESDDSVLEKHLNNAGITNMTLVKSASA
jgi:integrase